MQVSVAATATLVTSLDMFDNVEAVGIEAKHGVEQGVEKIQGAGEEVLEES